MGYAKLNVSVTWHFNIEVSTGYKKIFIAFILMHLSMPFFDQSAIKCKLNDTHINRKTNGMTPKYLAHFLN